ncbi:MAG: ABC transporter permease [Firmicutes bacterium]|nr:ABC transporter permease [Bacillota bacterium]
METTSANNKNGKTGAVKEAGKYKTFFSRVKPMIKLDFYRLFHTPAFYITVGIAALIPALVLTMVGAEQGADAQSFTNTWQVFEGLSGATAGLMDFANMANVNMVFIFAALLLSIFVSHDYGSGFVKNIFTVHAKKSDYVVSKSVVGIFGGACMILAYFLVTVIAGAIMGKSFDLGAAGAYGLIMCLLSKMVLMGVFVPLYLIFAVLFKQKLWMTIIATFAAGILFYPVASIAVPLDANVLTLIMCVLAAGIGFVGFGSLSGLILNKRDLA